MRKEPIYFYDGIVPLPRVKKNDKIGRIHTYMCISSTEESTARFLIKNTVRRFFGVGNLVYKIFFKIYILYLIS